MWTTEEINERDAIEAYCEFCRERDVIDALIPVYVATADWPANERLVHPECRDRFVADNLPAVLASVRGVSL